MQIADNVVEVVYVQVVEEAAGSKQKPLNNSVKPISVRSEHMQRDISSLAMVKAAPGVKTLGDFLRAFSGAYL